MTRCATVLGIVAKLMRIFPASFLLVSFICSLISLFLFSLLSFGLTTWASWVTERERKGKSEHLSEFLVLIFFCAALICDLWFYIFFSSFFVLLFRLLSTFLFFLLFFLSLPLVFVVRVFRIVFSLCAFHPPPSFRISSSSFVFFLRVLSSF